MKPGSRTSSINYLFDLFYIDQNSLNSMTILIIAQFLTVVFTGEQSQPVLVLVTYDAEYRLQ